MTKGFAVRSGAWDARLMQAAVALAAAIPVCLIYTRAGADVLIGAVDALFLIWCGLTRRWAWARRQWFVASAAWWGWTIVVSLPLLGAVGLGQSGWGSFVQALVMGRFFLFAAALGECLAPGRNERVVAGAVYLAAAWTVLQCWEQFLTGANIFGDPRWGDGALTGPFHGPRAGPAMVLLLFPAMLPLVDAVLRRPGVASRLAAIVVAVIGVATMVLIGQRMPALLTVLGLIASGILLRRFRPAVLAALVIGAGVLAATPVISPPTFNKLVLRFTTQLANFPESQYGMLYVRAAVITVAHPVAGLGFDGFKDHCDEPQYAHGLEALGTSDALGADPLGCSMHPHNHYLEAATAGGIPGLVLFSVMVLAWLGTLLRGLWRQADARRVGIFAATLIGTWPFASTSAFFTLPNAGWTFLLLGWGVALSVGAARPAPR